MFFSFSALKDETARSFNERSEGSVSLTNDNNHSNYDYEDENALTTCDHSSSVVDDIPITPKKPYRLLDPSKYMLFLILFSKFTCLTAHLEVSNSY